MTIPARIKLVPAIVTVLAVAALLPRAGQAATGGTFTALNTDTSISTSATGLSVSNPFPDGATSAQCFIQVTREVGGQAHTYGNCTGASLIVTCASASYDEGDGSSDHLAPSRVGASLNINGANVWTGAYDVGPNPGCANNPPLPNTTLAATLSGTPAGANVVWLVGASGAQPPAGRGDHRNGCWQYVESSGSSARQCFDVDYKTGPGAYYYEVTAQQPTGTIYQIVPGMLTGANTVGDMTLEGVFIESGLPLPPTATPSPTSAPAATSTATPTPPPTATPVPTETSVPLSAQVAVKHKSLKVGARQTITVHTIPGASVTITVTYPTGKKQRHTATAANGAVTWTYVQKTGLTRGSKHTAHVAVTVSAGGASVKASASYVIK